MATALISPIAISGAAIETAPSRCRSVRGRGLEPRPRASKAPVLPLDDPHFFAEERRKRWKRRVERGGESHRSGSNRYRLVTRQELCLLSYGGRIWRKLDESNTMPVRARTG